MFDERVPAADLRRRRSPGPSAHADLPPNAFATIKRELRALALAASPQPAPVGGAAPRVLAR